MLKTIKMAGFAAAVTLGGLVSFTAPSLAQSFEIIIGSDGSRVRARDYCYRNPNFERCRDWNRRYGDRYYRRDRCDANDALNKAQRMGIRRTRIVGLNERHVRVAGRDGGRPIIVIFGRRGGCPIVG